MPLDLDVIRACLTQTESLFWENDCRDLEDMCEADLAFIANAPAYVAALLSEVDRLTAENEALRAEVDRWKRRDGYRGAEPNIDY